MAELNHLLKSQSLLLAPFLNFVVLYFTFVHDPQGELWTTLLKCAPIVSLIMYIFLKGFAFTEEYKCSQRILIGLIFSCAGDFLLNIDLFPHGMGAFAVAQICYIVAFGWTPLKWFVGIPLYIAGAAVVAVVLKSLDEVLIYGLPIYTTLLLTMCWRSVARGIHKFDFLTIFCGFGSVLFVISDALIGVDMFFISIPHARIWIMITYYTAQFAIAVSTANECKAVKTTPKRSKKSVHSRINEAESYRRRAAKPKD